MGRKNRRRFAKKKTSVTDQDSEKENDGLVSVQLGEFVPLDY